MIHPLRSPLLLLATALATAPSLAQSGPVSVDASHLHALQLRLDGFAAGLPRRSARSGMTCCSARPPPVRPTPARCG
jgi:hypothetical protein